MPADTAKEATAEDGLVDYLQSHSDEIVSQAGEYSYLVGDSIGFIAIGMLVVFLLHRFSSSFLASLVGNKRFLMVTFGTLYVLVLVFTVLLVFRKVGFDTSVIGPVAILAVLLLAVVLYFIIPFLPRLPFMPGHTIETQGVMGTVDAVSTFHTTIRKFDGTMVFIPNALVMATKILNYSDTPNRRIEMQLCVAPDSDLDKVRERLLSLAAGDHRVLADPEPAIFAIDASAAGIELTLFCWVENADFLGARSDLWHAVLTLAGEDPAVNLALPRHEIQLVGERNAKAG